MVTVTEQAAPARKARPTDAAGRPLKRDMPLVPADTIAGRALVTVALARVAPGVSAVDPYSKAESEKLLQPWLGAGLDLGDLPVPRLIVVKLGPGNTLDSGRLREALEKEVPDATLDDHRVWQARLATMANATVAVGIVVFGLVLTAMLFAVAFATRGAMAGAREIIEVLHFVGAADGFISRQFQRHFLRLGLRGGAIGGGAAIVFFLAGGVLLGRWRTSAAGEQVEAMFGSFGLHLKGYVAILLIAGAIGLMTGVVSRLIVYRHLRALT